MTQGELIPDIELENDQEESVRIRDLVKDAPAVFFIYPVSSSSRLFNVQKANTPGCTTQA